MTRHTDVAFESSMQVRAKSPSNAQGLRRLGQHLLLAVGAAFFQAYSSPGTACWWTFVVMRGVIVTFLFCPLHECLHYTAFRSRKLNNVVAFCAGLCLCLPPAYFRLFHFHHHKHTNDPLRDPEIRGSFCDGVQYQKNVKRCSWQQLLVTWSGFNYWIERFSSTLEYALCSSAAVRSCDTDFVKTQKHRQATVTEARLFIGVYACCLFGSVVWPQSFGSGLLFGWILPLVCGQPFLRLYLHFEHAKCDLKTRTSPSSYGSHACITCERIDDARKYSNTFAKHLPKLVVWLSWNMPYHAEHHAFPAVPFWQLPDLAHEQQVDMHS